MKPPGMYLIGLTGNIACGKSSVVAILRELGAHVIDADEVTHALQQPGQPVYEQIVAAFGAGILATTGGSIDRRRLGAIVFADPAALRRLEQIVHPAVHAHLAAWLRALGDGRWDMEGRAPQPLTPLPHPSTEHAAPQPLTPNSQLLRVAVIDAIKLLESGWRPLCDAIWVVTCPPELQIARLVATRGLSVDEARTRVAAQPPQHEKVAQADVVIDNGGSREATRAQVLAAWQAIRARA